jgi:selenium metabolism protein YedF
MKVVDTRGERCPKPIIETRKAIKETSAGEVFAVLTDNKTSFNNISRFLADNGIRFSVTESDGVWRFEVNNERGITETSAAENYCEPVNSTGDGRYAVAITSEIMGSGSDELGRNLMKSFFVALSVMERLPSLIVFYNSGVKLAAEGSDVSDYLVELDKKGVELILCGTCVDYFKIGSKLACGKIGDMYQILEKLSLAGNVIRP